VDAVGWVLWLTWFVGQFVSFFVYKSRSGISQYPSGGGDWREWLLPNLGFWVLTFAKQFGWPVVLVLWLVRGRQECPWVAYDHIGGREVRAVMRRETACQRGLSS